MAEPESSADGREYSVQQDDAVCFSAGLTGATFGAGTIHAYLASDRKPPLVAAGISLGALSAAVMERCYRDLKDSRSETARWSWYRRYLSFLLNQPFDVVWDAIPNPSDLIADLPPVREPNLPVDEKGRHQPVSGETRGGGSPQAVHHRKVGKLDGASSGEGKFHRMAGGALRAGSRAELSPEHAVALESGVLLRESAVDPMEGFSSRSIPSLLGGGAVVSFRRSANR